MYVCVVDECIGPELTRLLRSVLLGALGDVCIESRGLRSWIPYLDGVHWMEDGVDTDNMDCVVDVDGGIE